MKFRGVVRFGVLACTCVAMGVTAAAAQAAVVGGVPVGSWQTNGRVEQIVVSGHTAYLAGVFTSMRPAGDPLGTGEVTRNHVAAIDVSTGQLLPWDPNANNTVQTVAVNGSTVYLGGLFSTVGGHNSKRLAAVDATSGAVISSWKATANAQVNSIAVGNGVLYAGGAFTQAGSVNHAYLAAYSLTTGAVAAWNPTADQQVKAIVMSADGSRVIAGGNFGHINGLSQNHLAALDPTTGAPVGWISHPASSVVALADDAGGVYAAITGAGGAFAGFNQTTGQQLWTGAVDGNVQGIGVLDGIVYAGGHFNNYCGQVPQAAHCRVPTLRDHLLAVDEHTGAIQAWHPSANGDLGVFALTGGDGQLVLGGDFTKLGGASQQGFGAMPEISDPTVTDSAGGQPTTTSPVTVTAAGSIDLGAGFAGYRWESSADAGVTWSANHNAATASIKAVGTTLVRFQAYDAAGNTSNWVTDTVVIS